MSQAEYAVMLTIYFSLFILFVNHKLQFIVSKTTLFFGKISYALYLIHQYLSINFIIPTLMNELHFRFPIAVLIAFLVSTLLAALITNYIEIPVRRLAKKHIYSKWGSTGSYYSSRSGRRILVRSMAWSNRHFSISGVLPLSNISGTLWPFHSAGRV